MDDRLKELLMKITQILHPLGYKKDGLNYRYFGDDGLCKIIHFQKNKYNTKHRLEFVINYGIYFEQGRTIKNRRFKEYHCIIRNRISSTGNLSKKEETWWQINAQTNIDQLLDSVREQMNLVFDAFDVFSDKETTMQKA